LCFLVVTEVPGSPSLKDEGVQDGHFKISLSVGDDAIQRAVTWQLASVNISHGAADGASVPAVTAAEVASSLKPEIHHVFRQPDKRPPALVSFLFAALAALPLVFLLLRLSQIGVNLKVRPTCGQLRFSDLDGVFVRPKASHIFPARP
jgi:oligosaccharyltransferase complex subunit delta (ribophorin II)